MLLDSDRNRITHMIEAADQALEYAQKRSRADVESDPSLYHLLVRNLEILGEAASRIGREFRAAHPEVPWRDIVDMRNRLIHVYFDIDKDIIWSTVQHVLPDLLVRLRAILTAEAAE